MIKKFKNGKIKMDIQYELRVGYYRVGGTHEENMREMEKFCHFEMSMEDLYVNIINGYPYIVDFNTQLVYDLPHGHFEMFLESLSKGKVIELVPYGKRASKELLQDLENGY